MVDTEKKELTVAKRQALPVAIGVSGALMPSNLPEAIEVAKLMAASGILPKQFDGNVGAVLIAIQMGAEIGLSPMAAIQNIAVINGRPSLWGDAVLAVVTSHPDCLDVIEEFDEKTMTATCTVKRRGRQSKSGEFSQADAKVAGLWGKQGPWTQYPKRMLKMRARGFACRDAFPDALRGLRVAEEVRDYGDAIDGEFVENRLDAGDHSFGFKPKPPAPAAETTTAPVEPEKAKATKQAPMTEKEKAWRAKQNGKTKAATHGPVTGEFPNEPPAPTPEELAKWEKVGPPPLGDEEPGSRG